MFCVCTVVNNSGVIKKVLAGEARECSKYRLRSIKAADYCMYFEPGNGGKNAQFIFALCIVGAGWQSRLPSTFPQDFVREGLFVQGIG